MEIKDIKNLQGEKRTAFVKNDELQEAIIKEAGLWQTYKDSKYRTKYTFIKFYMGDERNFPKKNEPNFATATSLRLNKWGGTYTPVKYPEVIPFVFVNSSDKAFQIDAITSVMKDLKLKYRNGKVKNGKYVNVLTANNTNFVYEIPAGLGVPLLNGECEITRITNREAKKLNI